MPKAKASSLLSERGFTLLSVLVTIALLGTFFSFFMAHFRFSARAEGHSEIQSDLLDLRAFVSTNLVCPVTCTPNAYVAITKVNTNPPVLLVADFSSGSPSSYGAYLLRAYCSPCSGGAGCSNGKRLLFQYLRGNDVSSPIADPLNGQGVDSRGAAVWSDLFSSIPVGCPLS